jgi:hypothetical protein
MADDLDENRLKFQAWLMGEARTREDHALTALVIEQNWSLSQCRSAGMIFSRYEERLAAGERPEPAEFEADLQAALALEPGAVPGLLLAFYDAGQWLKLCRWYAWSRPMRALKAVQTPPPDAVRGAAALAGAEEPAVRGDDDVRSLQPREPIAAPEHGLAQRPPAPASVSGLAASEQSAGGLSAPGADAGTGGGGPAAMFMGSR